MIGIIGAMPSEVEGLKARMSKTSEPELISGVEFVQGTINGTELVAAVAGVGKVNASVTAQTMILKYGVEAIVNVGIAGSLVQELAIEDVIVAKKVVEHDMDTSAVGDEPGYISGINRIYMDCDEELSTLIYMASVELGNITTMGTVASGDVFVSDDALRHKIKNNFGACAVEMEGASIGHVCIMNNIPFAVLRAISDSANGDSVEDYPAFAAGAAKKSVDIITLFLEKYNCTIQSL